MIWEIDERERAVEGVDAAGRPDPAYAAALGLLRAPFGRRALAYACDVTLWVILQLPLWLGAVPLLIKLATGSISSYGFVNHPDFVLGIVMASISVALSLVLVVAQLVLHGRRGRTIGKSLVGIRSVNVRTLERPGIGAVLLRYLIVLAAGIVPGIGSALILLTPTFDPDRRGRGWHDKATGVWLVDTRRGLNPFDEKRMRIARKMVKVDPLPERSELPSLATRSAPSAQPEYRPGSRNSAGVLGVSRPDDAEVLSADFVVAPPTPQPLATPPPEPAVAARAAAPAPVAQRPAPVPPPVAAPIPAPVAAPVPTPVAAPASPPAAPQQEVRTALFSLRLDTGASIPVSGPIFLGRDPDPADHPGARSIPVPDPSRSMSKTHLLVRPVGDGLEVVDWHSTNGSALTHDGVDRELAPGVPVSVVDGDSIRLGDRVADVVRM
ncbi:RDD family protein [Marisediminicola sp. LYQ134]|uniref:RDD family protein n=1 Tax=unclassified Marisediminicola TaxID=2618316 RepID=UPI003982E2DA